MFTCRCADQAAQLGNPGDVPRSVTVGCVEMVGGGGGEAHGAAAGWERCSGRWIRGVLDRTSGTVGRCRVHQALRGLTVRLLACWWVPAGSAIDHRAVGRRHRRGHSPPPLPLSPRPEPVGRWRARGARKPFQPQHVCSWLPAYLNCTADAGWAASLLRQGQARLPKAASPESQGAGRVWPRNGPLAAGCAHSSPPGHQQPQAGHGIQPALPGPAAAGSAVRSAFSDGTAGSSNRRAAREEDRGL